MKEQKKLIIAILVLSMICSILNGELWEAFTRDNSDLPGNDVTAIAIDNDNNKWIGTRSGVARYRNNAWTIYNTSNSQLPSDIIHDFAVHPLTGHIWIATNFGLARFSGTTWSVYNMANSDLPRNVVTSVAIDRFGAVWAGTLQGGAARLYNNSWTIFRTANSDLPHNNVRAIAITEDDKIWIGTDNGLATYSAGDWEIFNSANSGLIDNAIKNIAVFDENSVAAGTNNGGLVLFVDGILLLFHSGNTIIPSNTISAIAAKDKGILWIGTPFGGIVKSNNLQMTRYYTENSDIISDQINAIAYDNDNKKWIGTTAGLVTFNEISVSDVEVTPDTVIVAYGETEQLYATILPENATNKNYSWSSSNEDIATVNDTGFVTTHIPGVAYVRAISVDGRRMGSCYVYVTGTVAAPAFDPPSGNYEGYQYVTITSETEGAVIYYTLDESEPTQESHKFTEQIKLDSPVTIKARAFKEHWIASEISSAVYDVDTAVEDYIADDAQIANTFAYPNPVRISSLYHNNKDISISFSAKAKEQLEISVFDIRGRKIRDFEIRAGLSGENIFSFSAVNGSGKTLPPGIYLYSVTSSDRVSRGKFSVIR